METLIQAIDMATRKGCYSLEETKAILIAIEEVKQQIKKDESSTNE